MWRKLLAYRQPAATMSRDLARLRQIALQHAHQRPAAQQQIEQICQQLQHQFLLEGTESENLRQALLLDLAAHPNGYLRAAVLDLMTQRPTAFQVAVIVPRLNDWVPQVRLNARIAMRQHLQAAFFPAWLAVWPAMRQLYHCQREVHRHAVMEVEEFLLGKQHHPALCAVLLAGPTSVDAALLRECFRLIAHANLIPLPELVRLALTSQDRLIVGCAPAWISALPRAQKLACLRQGLAAPHPHIRVACFAQLLRQAALGEPEAGVLATQLALQWQGARQRRLRHLSRFWLMHLACPHAPIRP